MIGACLLAAVFALALPGHARAGERETRIMDALVAAYPDFLASHDGNAIVWKDGTRMVFDDGRAKKDFETLLNAPDIEDEFTTPYPKGHAGLSPPENIDPGRVRYEPLFTKMYGDCRSGGFSKHLKTVVWLPKHGAKSLRVTSVNGVADKLQAVSNALDALPEKFIKYLTPPAGVLACRTIAGTKRLSVHAFAAAVDISTKYTNYWRWSKPVAGKYPYKNQIPWEIVEIFEAHGFIWGGKWYHYDTMHFEYRPELLGMGG